MDNIQIIPLSDEYRSQARKLLDQVFGSSAQTKSPELYENMGDQEYLAMYSDEQPSFLQYYVAVDQLTNQVVGTTGLFAYDEENKANAFSLGWLCVDPTYRKQGIATALLAFSVQTATELGRSKLRLWTTDSPDSDGARALYEKEGFHVVSMTPSAYGVTIVMERSLGKI